MSAAAAFEALAGVLHPCVERGRDLHAGNERGRGVMRRALQVGRIQRFQQVAFELLDLLFGLRQAGLAEPCQFGAAAIGGDRLIERQLAGLHATHQRVEFIECLLERRGGGGSLRRHQRGDGVCGRQAARESDSRAAPTCHLAAPPVARRRGISRMAAMSALWMLVAALLFSVMGAMVKIADPAVRSAELVFYRSLIGVVDAVRVRPLAAHDAGDTGGAHASVARRGRYGSTGAVVLRDVQLPLGTAITLNYTSPLFLAALTVSATMAAAQPSTGGWWLRSPSASSASCCCFSRPIASDQQVAATGGLVSGVLSAIAYWYVRKLGQLRRTRMAHRVLLRAVGQRAGAARYDRHRLLAARCAWTRAAGRQWASRPRWRNSR